MTENGKKMQNGVDSLERDANNILWKRIKEKGKELNYGSFQVDIQVHAGQIRKIEIYNIRERLAVC